MAHWLASCLSYCFTFRRLSGSSLEVLSGRAGPRAARAAPRALCLVGWQSHCVAGLLAACLARWRSGCKAPWCGNGLEVLSGRAGPRAARAAPRAHAAAKIDLGRI